MFTATSLLLAGLLFETCFALDSDWAPFHPYTLAAARMDPLLFPGQVSPHTHIFFGPNNLRADATYETLRQSNCSTLGYGDADYSAYWAPAMYHISANGSFTLLPVKGTEIYYGWAHAGNDTAYPPGFKMIAGNPMAARHDCDSGSPTSATCNNLQGYYYCLDTEIPNGWTGPQKTMPRRRCNDRVGYHLSFPNCWDGQEFTVETQDEHLRYGINYSSEQCPKGWKRLPQLAIDFWFHTLGLPANSPDTDTYTLAFGGVMGAGLHADFINGWDVDVMNEVIKTCAGKIFKGDPADPYSCPILKKRADEQTARLLGAGYKQFQCLFSAELPQEDVGNSRYPQGHALPKLPGCNPMHTVTTTMPTCAPSCTPTLGPVGGYNSYSEPLPRATTCATKSAALPARSTSKSTSVVTTSKASSSTHSTSKTNTTSANPTTFAKPTTASTKPATTSTKPSATGTSSTQNATNPKLTIPATGATISRTSIPHLVRKPVVHRSQAHKRARSGRSKGDII